MLGYSSKVYGLRINNVLYSPLTLSPFKDFYKNILLKFDLFTGNPYTVKNFLKG